jgi:hypothetical protein
MGAAMCRNVKLQDQVSLSDGKLLVVQPKGPQRRRCDSLSDLSSSHQPLLYAARVWVGESTSSVM